MTLLALALTPPRAAAGCSPSRARQGRPDVVETKSSPTDVVTEMDRRAEALIIDRIRAARPGDAILGEEGGETRVRGRRRTAARPAGAVRWIVDPLDGTVNYLYGLPDWAVSIAAEVRRRDRGRRGRRAAARRDVPGHRGRGAWLRSNAGPAQRDWDPGMPGAGETGAARLRCTATSRSARPWSAPGSATCRARRRRPGRGGGRAAAADPRHPPRRVGVGRPVHGGGRPRSTRSTSGA